MKASCGRLLFIKGIIPEYLKHLTVAQSYLMNLYALIVAPIVERVPYISMLSLTEIGMPKRGGKNLSMFHSSSKVQFRFFDVNLSWSHSFAFLSAN